jgi:predicted DNA-binding transcriptional regulator AlpA
VTHHRHHAAAHATSASHDRKGDKLTIAEVCADLDISRRTFYEWRTKGRAPRCIRLPNGDLRIRRSEYLRWLAAREEPT